MAVAAIAALITVGDSSHGPARRPARGVGVSTHKATPRARAPEASLRERVRAEGLLPQTRAYPSSKNGEFRALMAALWSGIVEDSPAQAAPAFFPKAAYVRLKAIPSAAADWQRRLLYEYALDLAAAHALLGGGAPAAHLVSVSMPSSFGRWVEPGGCYNAIGYWELPNARLVYSVNGTTRSVGIASMISWRGVWYVVHLGAVLRATEAGTVDEPAVGPGRSAYSGTC